VGEGNSAEKPPGTVFTFNIPLHPPLFGRKHPPKGAHVRKTGANLFLKYFSADRVHTCGYLALSLLRSDDAHRSFPSHHNPTLNRRAHRQHWHIFHASHHKAVTNRKVRRQNGIDNPHPLHSSQGGRINRLRRTPCGKAGRDVDSDEAAGNPALFQAALPGFSTRPTASQHGLLHISTRFINSIIL